MATDTSWTPRGRTAASGDGVSNELLARTGSLPLEILRTLASLKITVTLFAMGIFIILVGTLAQVDKDMWEVIDLYFRSWVARIELQVFLPRSWAPKMQNVPGAFWFPGGAAIGAAMVVNLLAAHSIRFKPQARGSRLLAGLAITTVGVLMTTYVIVSGHNHAGLQGQPPFSWQTLWTIVKIGVGAACVAAVYMAVSQRAGGPQAKVARRLWWLGAAALAVISLWLFLASENAYLGDSGMRILWQLIQSTVCGLMLLAGAILIFAKRGGVVVIHAGIGLMMFGQFFVSKYDVEEQMTIEEGQTRSYAEDIRQTELAIVDASQGDEDQVTVIPRWMLVDNAENNGPIADAQRLPEPDSENVIRHESLPFDLQVLRYLRNADVRDVKPGEENLATAGLGTRLIAEPVKAAAGADVGGGVDLGAAYVRFISKEDRQDLGTYLLTQLASLQNMPEKVTVGDKTVDVALRFRRNYKPYEITLKDVRKDDYVGTSTPRNYSSDIRLKDASRDVDREIHIWMNNPLRYAGETFYQSGYRGPPDSAVEATTLSIVTNAGWMIPYVSCMIVFVGLCAHFGNTLVRFLRRKTAAEDAMIPASVVTASLPAASEKRGKGKGKAKGSPEPQPSPAAAVDSADYSWLRRAAIPAVVIGVFAVWLLSLMMPRQPAEGEMDLRAFARLPVIADGRVKPFDSLARNTLRALSNRETFKDANEDRQPAIRWLLDVMTQSDDAENHRVMRIDNLEVVDLFGLTRRKGNLYSINELRPQVAKFEELVEKAHADSKKSGPENLSAFQRKLIELDGRIRTYTRIAASFQPPPLPPLPTQDEFQNDRPTAEKKLTTFRDAYLGFVRSIDSIHPPLAIPVKPSKDGFHQEEEESWQPYSTAWATALIEAQLLGNEPPSALRGMNEILASYSEGNAGKFNQAVADYRQILRSERPAELQTANSFWNRLVASRFGSFYAFEEFFNHVSPFFFCWFPYLTAGVLVAASWLGKNRTLNRTAYWLTVFTFCVHTLALGARIYISGRPPVTNLYSSAVFIGWAVVLFCLVWERFYRDGIATFLASALGFATLLIAHLLAADGDTFTVLQAVLDTQFWLATHVVTVTVGYAATYLAGAMGIVYVLRGLFTRTLDRSASQELTRMIYGTTCFALLFSFIGTVLGGLWADDSWGRFWGWDPKENGALIIVLWNALILHARWDGMVKDRGLAVLAVGGNIVTSWSWFGVNELGVGLHSYGFTEGVMRTLAIFALSQVAIILAGVMPRHLWRSAPLRPEAS